MTTIPSTKPFPAPVLTHTYRVHLIPRHSPDFPFLTGTYSALVLRALSTDPASVGIAYATEAGLTPAGFAARLSRPNASVFVCVAHPPQLAPDEQHIGNGAWVGMITQIGPTPKADYWLRESGCPEPLGDGLEALWHHTGTWVDAGHRGHGIATLMMEASVVYAVEEARKRGLQQVRMRAITGPENGKSKYLYGRAGWLVTGRCTIGEAMTANGNEEYAFGGRTDWSEELMTSRNGVVMERVVRVGEGV